MTYTRYPFADMKVGDAFDVPFSAVSLPSLQAYASKRGRDLRKRFSVRSFIAEGVYEVSCVAVDFDRGVPPIRSARPSLRRPAV